MTTTTRKTATKRTANKVETIKWKLGMNAAFKRNGVRRKGELVAMVNIKKIPNFIMLAGTKPYAVPTTLLQKV